MSFRLTKKRKITLDTLKKHKGSMSAGDIHRKLPEIDLVTIYRNLDIFVQEKLIKKVHLDTDEAQYEYQSVPHHHALCKNCKKVIHFNVPDNEIMKFLEQENFNIEEVEIIVKGSCQNPKHL